jgi:hypothetical protein
MFEDEMKLFRIGNSIKYIAWGGFFLSIMAIIGQLRNPETGVIIISIIFGTASLYLQQLPKSNLMFTENYIMLTLVFHVTRRFLINWTEVQKIYTDVRSYTLNGSGKALTFSTFMTSKQDREKILEELENYVKKYNIEVLWQPEIITKMINTEISKNGSID